MRIRRKRNFSERFDLIKDYVIVAERDILNQKEAIKDKKYLDYNKIFNNDNPVSIEVGCGKGGFIIELAKNNSVISKIIDKIKRLYPGKPVYLLGDDYGGTMAQYMIGKFKDQIIPEDKLPICMTSYSPCFRKEVGAHGIEERGIYRVHQFEKQEMIVLCKPEESMEWYNKMWSYTVEFFRTLDVPVRTLECCSGDLADLKAKYEEDTQKLNSLKHHDQVERLARERYFMKRTNEDVFIIKTDK